MNKVSRTVIESLSKRTEAEGRPSVYNLKFGTVGLSDDVVDKLYVDFDMMIETDAEAPSPWDAGLTFENGQFNLVGYISDPRDAVTMSCSLETAAKHYSLVVATGTSEGVNTYDDLVALLEPYDGWEVVKYEEIY